MGKIFLTLYKIKIIALLSIERKLNMKKNLSLTLKNFLTIGVILIVALSSLTACSGKKDNSKVNKTPTVAAIEATIKENVDIKEMRKADENKLKKLYNIDSKDIAEFVLYTAPSNLKADEIAIIKVKDPNQLDDIKSKLEERVKAQDKSFKDYLPEEYYIIEKNQIKAKDNYIILAISKDVDKIVNSFEASFK